MEQIPTINYHDLKSNNVELSKFLEDSLNDVGFFVIKDHPISSESIDKLFNFTQELFDLPLDVKMKYHLKGTNGARGYTPYGIETALNKNVPDQKEFWHQGSCSNPDLANNLTINELENFDEGGQQTSSEAASFAALSTNSFHGCPACPFTCTYLTGAISSRIRCSARSTLRIFGGYFQVARPKWFRCPTTGKGCKWVLGSPDAPNCPGCPDAPNS